MRRRRNDPVAAHCRDGLRADGARGAVRGAHVQTGASRSSDRARQPHRNPRASGPGLRLPSDERTIALLVIDLDRFKYVNDTHGHPIGDDLLRVVADRLRALAGPDELVGRLGGDEFAVVQPVAGRGDEAGVLALRVCRELAAPYELGSIHASVGASVGVAFAARDATATSELLKAADMALYAAKGQGGARSRFFHPDMHHAVQRKVMIEGGLRNAIERDELYLAYQSIKDARSEQTVGYEALLRWRFGSTTPACRIHRRRRGDRADRADRRLGAGTRLRRYGAHAGRRPGGGQLFAGAVELFDVASHVGRCLEHFGLSADRLEIEVTESSSSTTARASPRSCAASRKWGAHFARRFRHRLFEPQLPPAYPFDRIKIDRSFVQKLERREARR